MKKRPPTTFQMSAIVRFLLTTFLLAAVLLSTTVAARADGGGEELSQTVEGYQVTLVFEKPAASGENPVHLRISDALGQPVSSAQVGIVLVGADAGHAGEEPAASHDDGHGGESQPEAEHTAGEPLHTSGESSHVESETSHESDLPSHGSDEHADMEMEAFTAGHEAGEYEGVVAIPGAGDWTLKVHVNVEDHALEIAFPLHVAGTQSGRNILLSYLAVNAAIVGVAAIFKFRPAAVQPIGD